MSSVPKCQAPHTVSLGRVCDISMLTK